MFAGDGGVRVRVDVGRGARVPPHTHDDGESSMGEVFFELKQALECGKSVAYCRLVETRGSTPQKAGAAMLVFEDGQQAGTLGGGCVEAEVKRRALKILADGEAEIVTFQLDSDYGWDDGLICGGRMQILIEPLRDATHRDYFELLGEMTAKGQALVEAIVFDGEKSGLESATSYLFDSVGNLLASCRGAIGGDGNVTAPEEIVVGFEEAARRPRASAERGIAYLPRAARSRLIIVGGGHVGQAVARWAPDLGFDVWVVDDREDIVSEERFPTAERRIGGAVGRVLPELEVTPDTYCLIVTRGHNHDEEALFHLVNRGAAYVGMIGSRRKVRLIFDDLMGEGISRESLAAVHAPVGVDIGSQTVPEIAISILAELVSHRNRHGEVPGRPAGVLAAEATDELAR